MQDWFNPLYEMDVFVRGRFLTTNTIHLIKMDVKDDIESVWGYKKETIEIVTYPLNLLSNWEVSETCPKFRTYVNPFTGEVKKIKGRKHGTGCIYKWSVSFALFCYRLRDFFTKFLY
jgi:hypothetical protein